MPTVTVEQAFQLAVQHHERGRLAEAEEIYRQILALQPDHADALHLLGVASGQTGRNALAEELIRKAIALVALNAAYHANLGLVLGQQGRRDEAMVAYRRALELRPDYPEAHYNLGIELNERGRLDEAIAAYRQALHFRPDYVDAHNNLGNALWKRGHADEAIAAYRRAIELRPVYAEAWNNLGNVLGDKGRFDEAMAAFRAALQIRPDFAEAWNNMGGTLKGQARIEEGIAAYRRALELKPDYTKVHSNLLFLLHSASELDGLAIYREHCRWDEIHARPLAKRIEPHSNDRTPSRRLRIGYVSPDFREHSVVFFVEGLLAAHNRGEVEVYCYADLRRPDHFTERLRRHAGTWRETAGMSDAELAGMIRKDGIDILVDLAGHTAENRLLAFARKPAPVQVTWLGYCDTTGMNVMDYRFTDAHADPPGTTEHLHTEKLLRLPGTFASFRPADDAPEVGLPPVATRGYITFGSFHTLAKLNDRLVERWVAILKQMPESRLLMVAIGLDESSCRQRYVDFFGRHGIASSRVEFRGRQTLAGYLALHTEVDVLLDSHPFSGHTVSCHALWMGVPVVTLAGKTHCSRMVTSVLMNLGLGDLIAQTPEEYVKIARELAADLPRLAELRSGLRERMRNSPLLDASRFARNVEEAYREMWRAWCAAREDGC